MWQTEAVKAKIEAAGYTCAIIPVESTGDIQLTQPIYALGISGVFTKQLDIALLNNEADLAVHSLKDVPTRLAQGLTLCAALERGSAEDVVILKNKEAIDSGHTAAIATSSLRRRAQWLAKYPHHQMVPIRGNVPTRLHKFETGNEMDGVIFAKAGLERLGLLPPHAVVLNWMLPAPAQGIIGIVCRDTDNEVKDLCNTFNHATSLLTGTVEREFLGVLQGGCSVPISALAEINNNEIHFRGAMHSYNGTASFNVQQIAPLHLWQTVAQKAAEELLLQPGATELLQEIRNKKWDDNSTIN
jgi:hydroxymethylbilane synthase